MPKKHPQKSIKNTSTKARRLKPATYKSFRISKRIKHTAKLPSAFKIFGASIALLKNHTKLFLGMTLIYGMLTIILVRGIGGGLNLTELKSALQNSFTGSLAIVTTAAVLFSYLVGSAGSITSATGGVYQTILIIIVSLAIIWALRQLSSGATVGVKDSFYKGMYPFVQFILVLMVVGLQLVPLLVGSWLYNTVINNAIAVNTLEKAVWLILFLLLALLSMYMICSSLFALYIVTLPDMTPMKALRSARQLVLYRRFLVLRKILFLPLIILVLAAIVIIPLIVFATSAAEWVFFALSMFVLVIIHSYMYTLYRELL